MTWRKSANLPVKFLLGLLCWSLIATALANSGIQPVSAQAPSVSLPYTVYLPVIIRSPVPPARLSLNFAPAATGIAVSPANSAIVYAGTYGGGVYKSVDGGISWTPINRGLPDSAWVLSMTIDPINSNRIYLGLSYNNDPNFASGVYRSDNGGLTWTATGRMDNPAAGEYSNHVVVYALAASANGAVIYAATRTKVPVPPYTYGYGGVFKSTNYGVTWTLVNNGLPSNDLYVYDLAVDPTDPNWVYAALHGSGVYLTTNGGVSWAAANSGLPPEVINTTADRSIAVNPINPGQLVFGTTGQQTFYSEDYADHWTDSTLTNVLMFAVDHTRINSIYASNLSGSIYYSTDFGQSWDKRADEATNGYLTADPNQFGVLYAGGSNGPFCLKKSLDAAETFAPVSNGINGYPMTSLAVDPTLNARMYASLFGWGIVASNDGGLTWTTLNNGLPSTSIQALTLDPGNSNTLYALTLSNGVYRTTDRGANWFALNDGYPVAGTPLDVSSLPYREIEPLESAFGGPPDDAVTTLSAAAPVPGLSVAVSPFSSANILVGTAGRGVIRWNGATWTATNLGSGSIYALRFDAATPGRVWLGGDSAAGSLRVSTDQGATWVVTASGLSGRTVYALSQGVSHPNILLTGTDFGVYLSNNSGASWQPAGLSGQTVKAVAVHPANSNRLLAATSTAIYLSPDGGLTWTEVAPQYNGFGYLGVTTTSTAPYFFYFHTRYGGLIKINE